jgi:hypothetical protein
VCAARREREAELLPLRRDFLKNREGIERTAFTTDNAAAGAAELKARGLEPLGPVHFGRPVDLPNGGTGEAKFNVFRWPLAESPGGIRIFACQHLTRHTVWIPELQQHANGASRIVAIEILAADPRTAAEHMSRLIDEPVSAPNSVWRVHPAADARISCSMMRRVSPSDIRPRCA